MENKKADDAGRDDKAEPEMRRIDVQDIMRGDTAVCLEFEGKQYILRITSNRKLILTK